MARKTSTDCTISTPGAMVSVWRHAFWGDRQEPAGTRVSGRGGHGEDDPAVQSGCGARAKSAADGCGHGPYSLAIDADLSDRARCAGESSNGGGGRR